MADIYFEAFDNISYPVLLINKNYRIQVANKASGVQFGISQGNLIDQLCYKATHNLDHPCWHEKNVQCPVKMVMECKGSVKVIHKHAYKQKYVLEEIIATPLQCEESGEFLVMEEFRDITELLGLDSNVLPICSVCRKIRDLKGNWVTMEEHIYRQTGADFSHSFCPDCYQEYSPKNNR